MTIKTRFVAFIAAGLAAIGALGAPAFAQTAGNVFQVRDIVIDQTAGTTADAEAQGKAAARLAGARRLIERLTLPEDRANADVNAIARMSGAMTFQENDRRTATRYLAVVAVAYAPSAVREHLASRNVPFVDSQAGMALIVPVAAGVSPTEWAAAWTARAADGSVVARTDTTVLAPYVASTRVFAQHPAWADLAADVAAARAIRVVIAEAFSQGGQIYVRLSEVRANQVETQIGQVGPFASFDAARDGVVAGLEDAWKRQSIVRTSGSSDMELTVSFTGIDQWVKIRRGLEASRLISNITTQSLSSQGADLRFNYSGREDQLQTDLRSRGLDLQRGDRGGWLLRAQ
jgi:hypothetical protein